jgi:hypothetical protein
LFAPWKEVAIAVPALNCAGKWLILLALSASQRIADATELPDARRSLPVLWAGRLAIA